MAQKQDFILEQQATHTFIIDFLNADNTARAIDKDADGNSYSQTLKFQLDCRQNITSSDHLFRLFGEINNANLEIQLGSSSPSATPLINDRLSITFGHALTSSLDFDKGYYDLLMYLDDKSYVEILMQGTVTVNKTITKLV